jgi:hypothetical protein
MNLRELGWLQELCERHGRANHPVSMASFLRRAIEDMYLALPERRTRAASSAMKRAVLGKSVAVELSAAPTPARRKPSPTKIDLKAPANRSLTKV